MRSSDFSPPFAKGKPRHYLTSETGALRFGCASPPPRCKIDYTGALFGGNGYAGLRLRATRRTKGSAHIWRLRLH